MPVWLILIKLWTVPPRESRKGEVKIVHTLMLVVNMVRLWDRMSIALMYIRFIYT